MSRKKIGIDIDDVLASHAPAFVTYCNEKWGTRLRVEDYTEHWSELWQVDMEEATVRVNDYYQSGLMVGLEKIDGAVEVLEELKSNYELVIITSRHRSLQQDTLDWIEKYYFGIFDEIHFAGIWDDATDFSQATKLTKAAIANELGVDILIDDQPKHCNAAVQSGIDALLFGNYPWHYIEDVDARVKRVDSWNDVRDYLADENR